MHGVIAENRSVPSVDEDRLGWHTSTELTTVGATTAIAGKVHFGRCPISLSDLLYQYNLLEV